MPLAALRRHGLRIAGALAILVLVGWYADPRAILASLAGFDPRYFVAAVISHASGNLASAVRWARIARSLGLAAPTLPLVASYARGITTNTVLPGVTVGGDLLRSYELHRLGNPLSLSVFSAFLDRFSGLWVLCVLSLIATAAFGTGTLFGTDRVSDVQLALYLALLGGIVAAPFMRFVFGWLDALPFRFAHRMVERRNEFLAVLGRLRSSVPHVLALSVVVQLFSAGAFWLALKAVGVDLPFGVLLAAAAPIFLMAALPLSFAGFGTRELAAVFVLGLAGVSAADAAGASILFGACIVIQGIAAAPLFLARRPGDGAGR